MRTWEEYKRTVRVEDEIFELARLGDVEAMLSSPDFPTLINAKTQKGHSPLMLAAYNGNLEMVNFLLSNGADPNSFDLSGGTILMGAAFKGSIEIVKALIEGGAKLETKNDKGQTALDFAQMFGRSEVVCYLKSLQQQPATFSVRDIVSGWGSFFNLRRNTHV